MTLKDAIHDARGQSWNEARPVYIIECDGAFFPVLKCVASLPDVMLVCIIRSYAQMP